MTDSKQQQLQQDQQEIESDIKETRLKPERAGKPSVFAARGAGKWAMGVPLNALGVHELIELASALGNNAMLSLARGGEGIETVEPYQYTFGPAVSEDDSAMYIDCFGGDEDVNEIDPAAPELAKPIGFGHAPGVMTPFAADALRDRTEAGVQDVNLLVESFGGAL